MRIQEWLGLGKIRSAGVVYPPETSEPGRGLPLCESSLVGFRLSCIYPTVFEAAAVAHGASLVGTHPGRGANVVSAIIRLARAGEPERTIALFGGDLTFRGWRRLDAKGHDLSADVLVVPHHGFDRGTSPEFGPQELARAVRPRFALFSVGTDNTYGHPAAEMVGAFRVVGATVLCTQITGRCVDRPDGIPGRGPRAGPGRAGAGESRRPLRRDHRGSRPGPRPGQGRSTHRPPSRRGSSPAGDDPSHVPHLRRRRSRIASAVGIFWPRM